MAIPASPGWIPEAKLRRSRSSWDLWIFGSLDGLIHVTYSEQVVNRHLFWVMLSWTLVFPCVEAGTDKVFSTLVLVVLDNSYNQRVPLILGTNLAERWRGDCQQKSGRDFLGERNVSGTWKRAYCALSSQEEFYDMSKNGSVKVRST